MLSILEMLKSAHPITYRNTPMTPQQKRSFRSIIASNCFIRIGDTLSDPKTILTWLLSALGSPAFAVSILVPIRESGSMLPQIFLASYIKKFPKRKPIYTTGLITQFICIIAIGIAALFLSPILASSIAMIALAFFATARAFCSITSKDILGRAIPKGRRGKLSGIASTLSGIFATALAIILLTSRDQNDPKLLATIIIGAGFMWLIAGISYHFVHEPAETEATLTEKPKQGILHRLALVKNDAKFRNFVIARTLLLGTALASPIFVVMAHDVGSSANSLIAFIVAGALASAVSSFIWGALSDRASHLAMAVGGLLAALAGITSIIIFYQYPAIASLPLTWPIMFFLFNIGYMGVRLGRSTWVVDAAEGDQRTDYVSTSNTIIATLIIILGLIAAPLQALAPIYPMMLYTICCITGSILALRLKLS